MRSVSELSKLEYLEQQSSELPGRHAETQGRGYKWTKDLLTADLLVCTVLQSQSRPDQKTFPATAACTQLLLVHMHFTWCWFTAPTTFHTFNRVTIWVLSARLNHCNTMQMLIQKKSYKKKPDYIERGNFQTNFFSEKLAVGTSPFSTVMISLSRNFFLWKFTPSLTRFSGHTFVILTGSPWHIWNQPFGLKKGSVYENLLYWASTSKVEMGTYLFMRTQINSLYGKQETDDFSAVTEALKLRKTLQNTDTIKRKKINAWKLAKQLSQLKCGCW